MIFPFVSIALLVVGWFVLGWLILYTVPKAREAGRLEAYREIIPPSPVTDDVEPILREAVENPDMIPALVLKLGDMAGSKPTGSPQKTTTSEQHGAPIWLDPLTIHTKPECEHRSGCVAYAQYRAFLHNDRTWYYCNLHLQARISEGRIKFVEKLRW